MNLDELEKLAEAANPGPWYLTDGGWHIGVDPKSNPDPLAEVGNPALADGAFIAAARTAVPELIEMIRKIRALHQPGDSGDRDWCISCGTQWPCDTYEVTQS